MKKYLGIEAMTEALNGEHKNKKKLKEICNYRKNKSEKRIKRLTKQLDACKDQSKHGRIKFSIDYYEKEAAKWSHLAELKVS